MIDVRPFNSLGGFKNDWLDAKHHFSFGHYHDPARMGVGALRVWNDDRVAAGRGFDMHPHRDMEIITYVRTGAITHVDNLGNKGRTKAGDVQVMHAGTGIVHGEFNRETEDTTLFQIWLMPNARGVAPGWEARDFPAMGGGLQVLASGDGRNGALPLHADGAVLAGRLAAGETVRHTLPPGHVAYLVPAVGRITVNGTPANTRDGVAISDETDLVITADEDAELVLVETV
jgi:redox-sensitive bicupin YhaK (pirin superfamily)